MSGDIKENVTRRSIWLRLVFMIVLSVAFNVAELIIFVVVVFQFLASLFTSQPNDQLTRFGRNLARYIQQITVYLTFATEEKPFPFTPWPNEPHEEAPEEENKTKRRDKSENSLDKTKSDQKGKSKKGNDTEAKRPRRQAPTKKSIKPPEAAIRPRRL
jgi:hypothetical protein